MRTLTTEAVTAGHPDKVCDQIADAILTAYLRLDPKAHVACEVMCVGEDIILAGEISSDVVNILNHRTIALNKIKDIGYNPNSFDVRDYIRSQSIEINNAVVNENHEEDQGAGDQGIMFGYACNETPEYLPRGVVYANTLAKSITSKEGYGPDGKTQITMTYDDTAKLPRISGVLVSVQHESHISKDKITEDMTEIINTVLPAKYADILINPSGSFVSGGSEADTGLTGRKLAVDTYGGYARFGGGALCGKDPSKVDRSGAYMARYIAKNICAMLRKHNPKDVIEVETQLSYAIGKADPMSLDVRVTLNGVYKKKLSEILSEKVPQIFDCRPHSIISKFDLINFDYNKVSGYCQFLGDYPWEVIDKVGDLENIAEL